MVPETPATGAADLIASRIPPGHIDWVVGSWVVFFVLVVSLFFLSSLGWLLFCCVAVPTTQQPSNQATQQHNNPRTTTQQPNNSTTQQPSNPTTQEPNNPQQLKNPRIDQHNNQKTTYLPNNPTTQPNNPTTQQPSNPATQQPNNTTTPDRLTSPGVGGKGFSETLPSYEKPFPPTTGLRPACA